jgi:hypothetical protein
VSTAYTVPASVPTNAVDSSSLNTGAVAVVPSVGVAQFGQT